jgi:O-palmitoleoyl-L-serine hydrolase
MRVALLALSSLAAATNVVPPNNATLVLLEDAAKSLGAVCLDGSPAAYYIRKEAETTKFYVHQEGGGWCSSDEDCLSRSHGSLGSSKGYAAVKDLGSGYFSNDPDISPLMYNWTKIYLPYCDGA